MKELNLRRQVAAKTGYVVLLLGFFLLSYILPLGVRDLIVPDETRYGEIPREMIAKGDWIVPHFNGIRYFEKPVLGYWIHAGSLLLFGENNFGVRFPSAAAVGLSSLLIFILVYGVCRRNNEKPMFPATLAALISMSCFEVFGVGNTAVLDNLLSLFLTGIIAAFFFASEAPQGSLKERGLLLVSGISCGLAFLTKGFLAFALPILTLVPYLAWQRRWLDILRMGWLPILSALLVSLPWAVLIHIREPDFWHFFFWNEHIRRFFSDNAQHKESLWFFLLTAPALFFPWVMAVPAAVPGVGSQIIKTGPKGRLIRLSVCWLILPFLFFSFSSGKLLTYMLPCFQPFAILVSFGLSPVPEGKWPGRLFQWAIGACATIFGLIMLGFAYIQFFGPNGNQIYSHSWKAMMVVDGLLFYVIACILALRIPKERKKIFAFAMAPLLFYMGANFIIPDSAAELKSPGPLLERNREIVSEDVIVITDRHTNGAACWYLQRDNIYILCDAGELTYGLGYEDAAARQLNLSAAIDLIHRNPGKVVLVARMVKHPRWLEQLPEPMFRDDSGRQGYEVWKY